ncbi:MAG: Lrp/AsnC family transcriptional regulator [Gemmatimonadota bacterium]
METPLDRTDRRLIELLVQNARLSNRDLAERVGLSPSACLERVRRLFDRGVLTGAHAVVDPGALGVGVQAVVAVRLARHTRELVEAFRQHTIALPEVRALYHVTGEHDFLMHVATRDIQHLRDFTMDALTTQHGVAHLESFVVFAAQTKPGWPDYLED